MSRSHIRALGRKLTPSPWRSFARNVRGTQEKLLSNLDAYPQSVLVTGCQRSGTTAISRLLRQGDGIVDFQTSHDDELDGALILAGQAKCEKTGRFCFQTTYLNERYQEYIEHPNHYIVWVLRNPHSVINSMLTNWKDFALNELFLSCGYSFMDHQDRVHFQRFGLYGVSRLHRAIYAYLGKLQQLLWLKANYPKERLITVEYDQVILEKDRLVPSLFDFSGIPFKQHYNDLLKNSSLNKKHGLSDKAGQAIEARCTLLYNKAVAEVTLR